jgi:uncharacterized membrane protein (DUF106 family)
MKIILLLVLIVVASAVAISLSQSAFAQSGPEIPYQASTVTTSSLTSSTNQTSGWFGTGFIVEYVKTALKPYRQTPQSTLLTIGIAVLLGLTSSTAAKLLVDYDMIRKTTKEFQAWRKEMDAAKKANDNQALSKLMKKQQAMTKLQAKASMEQFKVTAVTFVPFLLLWYLLNAVFAGEIVAVSPWPLPLAGTNLNFVSWYFLSSFAVNFPMMRLFGIGMGEN